MADYSRGDFPTMGESVAQGFDYARPVGGRSVRKTGEIKGGTAPRKTANHRSSKFNPLGDGTRIQATVCYPQSPEASKTQNNTKWLPSKAGAHDFRCWRDYGQGL